MESLCTVCNETNTKYTCIICEVFVCNKRAKAASENVDGYNEELKQVGKCPDCDRLYKNCSRLCHHRVCSSHATTRSKKGTKICLQYVWKISTK